MGLVALLVALGIWQAVANLGLVEQAYIGTPIGTAGAGKTLITNGELWANVQSSLYSFGVGFGISIVVGIPIGLAMGWSRLLRWLAEPPMMALYATPRLALLPLIVVWAGIGTRSAIIVVILGAVIPIIINIMAGVRSVEPMLLRVADSFGASRYEIFRKILLPSALPSILTGVRLGVGRGILGVVVTEMYVSTKGIGHLVTVYGQAYRTEYIVFIVVLVGVFGWAVTALVQVFEDRVQRSRGQ